MQFKYLEDRKIFCEAFKTRTKILRKHFQTFYKINRGMSMLIEPFALGVRSSSQNYLLRNSDVFIVVKVVCKLISVLWIL